MKPDRWNRAPAQGQLNAASLIWGYLNVTLSHRVSGASGVGERGGRAGGAGGRGSGGQVRRGWGGGGLVRVAGSEPVGRRNALDQAARNGHRGNEQWGGGGGGR